MLSTAILVAAIAGSQPVYGIAVAGDGDSITVWGERIRLFGIDAPEFDQTCNRGGQQWACGQEAANQLAKLVTGKEVRCVPTGEDAYGRTVARCSVGTIDVNRVMVAKGYAVAFRKYSVDYVSAENTARSRKLGIWAGSFENPSEVRAAATGSAKRASSSQCRSAAPQRFSVTSCSIKGNRSRRGDWIYHMPGMPYYEQTQAEETFCSEAAAKAAGYRRAIVR